MFKLSLNSVYLALALSSFTFASYAPHDRNSSSIVLGHPQGEIAGAAYLITNGPQGNYVVSADIAKDGTLNIRQATPAGGYGAHGNTANGNTGPDPFFSQSSVTVNQKSRMLATVNAGSNTLALFKIDPSHPSELKSFGWPASTGGEFPISVAFNNAGDMICALNGGARSGVSCFKIDPSRGLVSTASSSSFLNLNQTTPPSGPPGTASQIRFSVDDKQVLVAAKGTANSRGFIAMYDLNDDGSVSQDFKTIDTPDNAQLVFSITPIPGKNAALSADPSLGYQIFDFANNKSTPFAIPGQMANCWSSYSPKTGHYYLSDPGTGKVSEVSVDDNLQGSLVNQIQMPANSSTLDNTVASIGDQDFLYVLSAAATAVDVVSLGSGQAKAIQRLDITAPAAKAGISIASGNLQGMATFVRNE